MSHRLGIYWAPGHGRPGDLDYMRRLQPPAIRVLDPDVQHLIDAHTLAPDALILPRDWALSEQKDDMRRDPVGTGRRHAEEWRTKISNWRAEAQRRGRAFPRDEQIVVVGINEPPVWEALGQTVAYTVAFLDECKRRGLRACALNLSVGWPSNTGDGTPPDWSPYEEVYAAIVRGGHFLTLHEYWYHVGPEAGWGWYAGRLLKCPWDVPIVVGECGVDNYVDLERWRREGGNRGWRGHLSAQAYADQMFRYIDALDRRVVAVLPFLTDYRGREWESFDTEEAHEPLLAHAATPQQRPVNPPLPEPTVGPAPEPVQPIATGIVDPKVAATLIQVESGGQPFGPDGRVLIRFEVHIFLQRSKNPAARDLFRHGSPAWEGHAFRHSVEDAWIDLSANRTQALNYEALDVAARLDRKAAYESISMGLGQIMGFNHARVGYVSAEAMHRAFASEWQQVLAFINFFLSSMTLTEAVRHRDWRTIAQHYNGPGNVDRVAPLLEATYRKLGGT